MLNYTLEDILPLYKEGMSLTKIAQIFKTTRDTLARMLKNNNIEVVNHQNLTKFDETIFDSLESEESVYWFGFILADGNISKSNFTFELSLSAIDVEHLQKFNHFSKHNKNNVRIGSIKCGDKEFQRCRWSITNKHLWNTLYSYGCVPNKSKILEFPKIMENSKYIRHFIRGYFDGDGCITYRKTDKELKPSISMLGTKMFLSKVKKILNSLNIETSEVLFDKHKPETFTLNIHSKSCKDFLNFLYKDSNIYLTRKFKRYEFFNTCRSVKELTELLMDENGESCDANTVLT